MEQAEGRSHIDHEALEALEMAYNPVTGAEVVDQRLDSLQSKIDRLREKLETDAERKNTAESIVSLLTPGTVDVQLWRSLALGENFDLPVSDQYGPDPQLHRSKNKTGSNAGNLYGRVHSKGEQAPSAFMKRQGQYLAANARKIAEVEEQLAKLHQKRNEIESGLKLFASTALLTAMRKAVAPIFALGPAWTVLSAIHGSTAGEKHLADRAADTNTILMILHALRDNSEFKSELKSAILALCYRYKGVAHRTPKDLMDFGHSFDAIIKDIAAHQENDKKESWEIAGEYNNP